MNLVFTYQGIERSIDSILEFTKPGTNAFWSSPIFHFFPELDKDKYIAMDEVERKEYLVNYFENLERENVAVLEEKVTKYNARWEECHLQIVAALEDAFECNLTEVFQDMRGYITFNSISPRYLENNSFDVFYLNSENGAIGLAIHEIIHFVWFYVWSKHFILEVLHEMRQRMSVREFMEESYAFCLKHEQEIREHIERSELGECDGN